MRLLVCLIILVGIMLSAGCQPTPADILPQPTTTSAPTSPLLATALPDSPDPATGTPDRSPTMLPERVPPMETGIPVTGEVPAEIMDLILADLAERTSVARDQISVIRSEETVWNDGSLGCAQPGQFYTQALVNGYWVVLEVEGQEYDYRIADSGHFFLCENTFRPIPPAGTPDR